MAKELVGGNVVPVAVQGTCSYSVYARRDLEYVVQFRTKTLAPKSDIVSLAAEVYGPLVPGTVFEGTMEDQGEDQLCVYRMDHVRGIIYLDFTLASTSPENSPESFGWRKNLVGDIAHFMALPWKSPQKVDQHYQEGLRRSYLGDLQLLDAAVPARFRPIVKTRIDSLDDVLSLPMVISHGDFGCFNIMVDEATYHMLGVIDWAEPAILPFGMNLHSFQAFTGKLHLRNGWMRASKITRVSSNYSGRYSNKKLAGCLTIS